MFTIAETTWQKSRDSLSAIRELVFIQEQQVPVALEWDGLDEAAVHLLAWNLGGTPIGCARLLPDYKLGRMAVLPEYRMQGVGSAILQAAVEYAAEACWSHISISAQIQAIGFYIKSGFVLAGGEYMDAGIPHRDMCLYF